MTVRIRRDTLSDGLDEFDENAIQAIQLVLDYWATRAMTQMKTNAPWTDRTTNARNGLMAKRFEDGDSFSLVLWHTVPYGIWLEVRWSGRYAIIGPTLNDIAPKVLQMAGEAIVRVRSVG